MSGRGIAAGQAAAPAKFRVPPARSLHQGPASQVADDSPKPWPATPTAPFNWVWIPG